ncbi:DUF4167 domain-containing protein [Aliiroseovarius subalbicans]|uniref:DUF4167 domain-containing protein n=1 Tax=Aliiroseovarius subalbicans TaxID=2925840 RepID=UPI001F5A72A6|nr:DUF4167 domain-containing protein [Aliiroseovarius subalbicans]MCI2398475.1 DUF4167 domain-containing protein [Aliiroseovarius subalbicans]
MKSSRSRSRGKSNRNRSNNNPGNNLNRVFDSSGPEGKVRGTPQQIIDKYSQLARDAQLSNDRVAAENFQQHAEHYTRLQGEAQRDADARRAAADEQNRQRQEREREAREAREARNAERRETDQAAAPQPDMVESPVDTGLVETPENAPKKRASRSRKPKAKPDDAASVAPENPEAAE